MRREYKDVHDRLHNSINDEINYQDSTEKVDHDETIKNILDRSQTVLYQKWSSPSKQFKIGARLIAHSQKISYERSVCLSTLRSLVYYESALYLINDMSKKILEAKDNPKQKEKLRKELKMVVKLCELVEGDLNHYLDEAKHKDQYKIIKPNLEKLKNCAKIYQEQVAKPPGVFGKLRNKLTGKQKKGTALLDVSGSSDYSSISTDEQPGPKPKNK